MTAQENALRMALDMIEYEKFERRHVRWAIIDALKEIEQAKKQEPVIYNTAWQSPHDDDRWCENPDDWEIIEGFDPPVFVGFEYELTAGRYTTERYRVTKIAGDTSDDFEVELVVSPQPEKNGGAA